MSKVDELVHEMTRDHKRFIERDNGAREAVDELSLLSQLDEAKTLRLHASGGSSGGSKTPLGVAALDIEAEISEQTSLPGIAHLPLPVRVQMWAKMLSEELVIAWLEYWSNKIRELFVTKFAVEGKCPECQESETVTEDDGEVKKRPALMVTVETQQITCGSCSSAWFGVENLKSIEQYI